MTLENLISRFRLLVPECPSTVISDADLTSLLNDGQLDITMKTNCLAQYAEQNVVDGTQEYSIPSDSIKITAVYYGGTGNWEKLPEVTMNWLSQNRGDDWINDTGEIMTYFKRRDKIGLYKTPTSSEAGTNYLRIYYTEQPDSLTGSTNVPFSGLAHLYPYHELVLLYAMYKAKQVIGKYEQSKYLESDLMVKANRMKIEIGKLDDFNQVVTPYYKSKTGYGLKENPLDQ